MHIDRIFMQKKVKFKSNEFLESFDYSKSPNSLMIKDENLKTNTISDDRTGSVTWCSMCK